MGQYHRTVNFDKQEYISPHKLGMGLKQLEQVGLIGSMGDVLFMLLASSNNRGGGDIHTETKGLLGRWAGDRVAVIGDYSEDSDIPGIPAKEIYGLCSEEKYFDPEELELIREKGLSLYTDISDKLVGLLNEQFGFELDINETGWRRRGGSK